MPATKRQERRTQLIIDTLGDAFAPLMRAAPPAFRAKYRKMAKDPHAFFRGTACHASTWKPRSTSLDHRG